VTAQGAVTQERRGVTCNQVTERSSTGSADGGGNPHGSDRPPALTDAIYFARMSAAMQVHLECAVEQLEEALGLIPGKHGQLRQAMRERIVRSRQALARWRIKDGR
jgi:hypothetical protein